MGRGPKPLFFVSLLYGVVRGNCACFTETDLPARAKYETPLCYDEKPQEPIERFDIGYRACPDRLPMEEKHERCASPRSH